MRPPLYMCKGETGERYGSDMGEILRDLGGCETVGRASPRLSDWLQDGHHQGCRAGCRPGITKVVGLAAGRASPRLSGFYGL